MTRNETKKNCRTRKKVRKKVDKMWKREEVREGEGGRGEGRERSTRKKKVDRRGREIKG